MKKISSLLLFALILSGCATPRVTPQQAVNQLENNTEKYETTECRNARQMAMTYDDNVGGRIGIGMGLGLLMGPFGIPMAAAVDKNQNDKREAVITELKKHCEGEIVVAQNSKPKSLKPDAPVITKKPARSQFDLQPDAMKRAASKDAVAIIIGIQDYKHMPSAEFANDDARHFYQYAIRALGVPPENIRALIDSGADQSDILKTFKIWLPQRVKSGQTEIYVFYSGHGLPTKNGDSFYFLPTSADKDFLDESAIELNKIIAALKTTNPKSVTFFLDSCYSGYARSGDTLLANARPAKLKSSEATFPSNFTVIAASQSDQISSSSPELKHGIFSYYLMRGMEGDADLNKDGKITTGEMHDYLAMQVPKQAEMLNRDQRPQMIGDKNRVLVNR
jgi:hypothetical protein